mgnify:CR=1 FL=1
MRPNFPSQMAQRFAAPSRRYWGLLHIFASCGSRVGSSRDTDDTRSEDEIHCTMVSPILWDRSAQSCRRPSIANSKTNSVFRSTAGDHLGSASTARQRHRAAASSSV